MDTKCAFIYSMIIDNCDSDTALKITESNVSDKLLGYKPTIPADGSGGFIAFALHGKRMKTKTGRFLVKKLGLLEYLPEKTVSDIAFKINQTLFDTDLVVKLDVGQKIQNNYQRGIGGSSCMTGRDSDKVGLYKDNPDRFAQLVMIQGNNSSRAIVHTLDNGKKLMDRVYATCEVLKEDMISYAIKNEWYYRSKGGTVVKFNHSEILDYDEIIVSGLDYTDGEIPYADTLKCGKFDGGLTMAHSKHSNDFDFSLEITNGYIEDNQIECDECGCLGYEDDITYIVGYGIYVCQSCYDDNYTSCENCDEIYRLDDIRFIQDEEIYVCKNCIDKCAEMCDECERYFNHTTNVDNKILCNDCIEDCIFVCDKCGDIYMGEGTEVNNEIHCHDCAEQSTFIKID